MRRLIAYAPFVVLIAAFALLYAELRHLELEDFLRTLKTYSAGQIALALGLVAVNYGIWSLYDFSSLRQLGVPLPYVQIFRTCAMAFPLSNLIGYSMISGFAVRVKCYSRRGLSLTKITQLILFNVEAWWVGFLSAAGAALLAVPEAGRLFKMSPFSARALGIGMLALVLIYLAGCAIARGRRVNLWRVHMDLPDLRGGLYKLLAGGLDAIVIALTFYVLLPEDRVRGVVHFSAFYLVGQLIAILSFVPGGLGVLEGSLLFLLRPYLSDAEILSSLVLFRVVHYLIPAGLAAVLLLYIGARKSPGPTGLAKST